MYPCASQDPAAPAGLRHGGRRRHRDLCRAGAAQQPARPFPAGERPPPARPLRDLYREQHPYVQCSSAGECVGLYYTCISSYPTPAAGSWLAHPDTSRLHPTARGRAAPHAERFADAELDYRRRAQRTRRNDTMEKERLLAFTDGVIAVITTIMVLEMKVPQDASLGSLRSVRPVFLSYAIAGERVRRF